MSRFESHLKKNIVNINKNLYITPSDSLYYEKIIRYIDPHSPEAHYKLGQKNERQGSLSKALIHYTEATAHIDSPYYLKAKKSSKILEDKINENNLKESVPALSSKSRIPMFAKSIIAFLLLFNLFLLFFLFGIDPMRATVSTLNSGTPEWMWFMKVLTFPMSSISLLMNLSMK
jgi:tetratricopeptide (TPR) repeat protein